MAGAGQSDGTSTEAYLAPPAGPPMPNEPGWLAPILPSGVGPGRTAFDPSIARYLW